MEVLVSLKPTCAEQAGIEQDENRKFTITAESAARLFKVHEGMEGTVVKVLNGEVGDADYLVEMDCGCVVPHYEQHLQR